MKFASSLPSKKAGTQELRKRIPVFLSSFFISLWLGACTIAPKLVHDAQPSWDGNAQNSGLLEMRPDHSALVTPAWRDRYHGLIAHYGGRFHPPLSPDAGLTPAGANYICDAAHLVKMGMMNTWRKSGH